MVFSTGHHLWGSFEVTGMMGTGFQSPNGQKFSQKNTHAHYLSIYIWHPPWDLPQSILIYCLYIYIFIIIYLCAYMYKSQLFFKDVLWVVAVHTIKTSWKQQTKKHNIWRLFGRESMRKTKKNKKPRENQQKTIYIYIYIYIWILIGRSFSWISRDCQPGFFSLDYYDYYIRYLSIYIYMYG